MTIFITKILSKTPLFILYLFSDFLFFLVYYIIKYRRDIVDDNLKHAFPEKSDKERKEIAKKCYKHFCDVVAESLKILSPKQLQKRFIIENPEFIKRHKKGILIMTAHYGNWEWFQINQISQKFKSHFVYQSIRNPYVNKMAKYLREKRGHKMILRKRILKHILSNKENQTHSWYSFAADQSPGKKPKNYWIEFMNRETLVYTEIERIAKVADLSVVVAFIKKQKRGHYKIHFELINEDPNQHPNYEITNIYFKKLEDLIRSNPEYYLWTHNRWKHKRETHDGK